MFLESVYLVFIVTNRMKPLDPALIHNYSAPDFQFLSLTSP